MKEGRKQDGAEPATPERADAPTALAVPSPRAPLTPARVVALQRLVGNAAVTALVDERRPGSGADGGGVTSAPLGPSILDDVAAAGRPEGKAANVPAADAGPAAKEGSPPAPAKEQPEAKADAPAPAAEAAPASAAAGTATKDPNADPRFQSMKARTKAAAGGAKAHAPAKSGAAAAQAAALPPGNDVASQAAAAQVDTMSEQKPGAFDRAGFIAAVKAAIDKAAPKNLEEADDFKAEGVKDAVSGQVKDGKKGAEKDIKGATDAAPDTSKAKPKAVTPMAPEEAGPAPPKVGAAGAMPTPVPAGQTDLKDGPAEVDKQMADAEVTDDQIHKSNEPDFKAALGARDAAKEHAGAAPQGYRKSEQDVLGKAHGAAEQAEVAQLAGMHSARGGALAKATGHKQGAKSQDEAKRAKVATDVQGIYDRTKADVTKTLDGLDGKVDSAFTQGEAGARKRFEDSVAKQMDAYKDDRYSGLLGKGRWLKDKLMGMPAEVNRFYSQGRTRYLADMDGVIGRVADLVGAELTAARARIAQGKAEVHKYVTSLPKDLQEVGKEAESNLQSQFDQLSSDVDSKQDELVDTLAKKYVEARDALDAKIDEMKAANRGLVDKAIDAVGGVIKTILQLKNMLLGVLAKAADVIGDIIADPIGFLGNLIDGIKGGLTRFVGNIATHLQEGLMGWLFGALGGAGITIPKTFDLAGIVDLVLQVLGLTYQNIRARVVRLVGERVMQRMEQTVDVFKTLVSDGVGGLWKWLKDRVGDLEDLVLGEIKTFIIEKVIKAGVVWLIAFLNPAAAFIKACKAIYDIVMFLVERGSEIMSFVSSILDSLGSIAKGAIGIVAEKVEGSLAKALPLAISFLASLLGLGGISDKIHQVIDKVRSPINKAVDFIVMGAVKGARKLFGWGKSKVKGAKDWAKGKAQGLKDRFTGKDKKDAEPKAEGEDVKREAARELKRRAAGPLASVEALREVVAGVLADLRPKGLKAMKAVARKDEPGKFDVLATASPTEKVGEADVPAEADEEMRLLDDGATSLEDRRALLAGARQLAGAAPIGFVLDYIRGGRLKAGRAVDVLRRIVDQNLAGGYRLTTKEKPDRTYGRILEMDYFGLHDFNNNFPKVGRVPRAANNPLALGLGYVKPVATGPNGEDPVPALGVDFLVPPAVEQAKIVGVGSAMMTLAAQHFDTQYEAVVGEWYTAKFYASKTGNRPPQSKNLTDYLAARKAGLSEEEAAKTTWTYRRVKEIYGGAELDLQVRELVPDLDHLPAEAQIVEVLMKPR